MSADHNAIGAFLDAQAAEAGAARNTLLAYGRDLRDLSDWLGARALSPTSAADTPLGGPICPPAARRFP